MQNTFRPLPDNGCGIWLYDKDIFSSGFDSHKSSTFSSTSTWYSIDKVIGYMSYDTAAFFEKKLEFNNEDTLKIPRVRFNL